MTISQKIEASPMDTNANPMEINKSGFTAFVAGREGGNAGCYSVKIETMPTPEWMQQHHGNVTVDGGGRMEEAVIRIVSGNLYDLFVEEVFRDDRFTFAFNQFLTAKYAFDIANRACAGRLADVPVADRDAPTMADLYSFLLRQIPGKMATLSGLAINMPPGLTRHQIQLRTIMLYHVRHRLQEALQALDEAIDEHREHCKALQDVMA